VTRRPSTATARSCTKRPFLSSRSYGRKIWSSHSGSTSARQAATLCVNASVGSTRVTSATSSRAFAAVIPAYPPPTTTTLGREFVC
jgi:hypothetical protein